jgi:hypothetical protein
VAMTAVSTGPGASDAMVTDGDRIPSDGGGGLSAESDGVEAGSRGGGGAGGCQETLGGRGSALSTVTSAVTRASSSARALEASRSSCGKRAPNRWVRTDSHRPGQTAVTTAVTTLALTGLYRCLPQYVWTAGFGRPGTCRTRRHSFSSPSARPCAEAASRRRLSQVSHSCVVRGGYVSE